MNETLREKLKKLLSTKFIGMVGSIAAGVLLITQDKYIEGTALIIGALITYCISNAYITVKTTKSVVSSISDIVSEISAVTENKIDDAVAQILKSVNEKLEATDTVTITTDDLGDAE